MSGRPKGRGDWPLELKREAVAYAREHTFKAAMAHFGVCRRSLFRWAAGEDMKGHGRREVQA